MMTRISIFGLGYVGCVSVGCLAQQGHYLVGVDAQDTKVSFINEGRATIIEKDIDRILAEEHAAGRISATKDVEAAVLGTDVSFICVGTPSTPSGHLDLAAVHKVSEQIGHALRKKKGRRHVIAVRSTVFPGTGEAVMEIIARASQGIPGEDFAVVSNPEFLREGSSVEDFNSPSFTLIGSDCAWAIDLMRCVYARIKAPLIATTPRVAELMKYICNSFHALKITFANEVGNICKKLEIDSRQLMDIFCQDTKLNVSRAYLKPGFAYGGSCLPKDLKALRTIAHDHYLQTPVLEAIERSNEFQKDLVLKRILDYDVPNVGFIGLAFKTGTDDLRDSPIIDVIERLLGKGFNVRVFDRHVHLSQLTGANRDFILKRIPFISRFLADDLVATIRSSDLLVIVNRSEGLTEALAEHAAGKPIYDLAGVPSKGLEGSSYSGIAW
jgi:GDP-mannose 6-dehydrogenase